MIWLLLFALAPLALVLGLLPARWFAPIELADLENPSDDVWANYHPCRGCGQPLSSRANYCDEQCRREYRAREAASEAPTERIDPSTSEIPF